MRAGEFARLCIGVLAGASLFAGGARAEITAVGGSASLVAPPADAQLGVLQSNTAVSAWNEKQNAELAAPVPYTIDGTPGTYDEAADVAGLGGTLPIHAIVDSHLIHFDQLGPGLTTLSGFVEFATPILAVITTCANLQASDAALGSPTTVHTATCAGTSALRGVDWGGGFDPLTISADRRRISFSLRTSNDMDEIRVLTLGELELSGPLAFAVLRKNGAELILNLGDPQRFPATGFHLDLGALPPAFGGDLLGAEWAIVGSLRPTDPVANLLFTECADPRVLTDGNLTQAFQRLVGGGSLPLSSAWLRIALNQAPTFAASYTGPQAAPNSFTTRIGQDFLGAFPFSIHLPVGDDRMLTAVFQGVAGPPGFSMDFPFLLETFTGLLRPLVVDDIKSETFAVFAKNDAELVVNLGSHDDLPAAPISVASALPTEFGPDGLLGAQFALVGFFLESIPDRANLMLSAPNPPPSLAPATVELAFRNLSGTNAPPVLGFIDLHADLPRGGTRVIAPASTASTSFVNQYGCDARGALAFSICGTVGPDGLTLPIVGAATNPLEYAGIATVSVDPVTATLTGIVIP